MTSDEQLILELQKGSDEAFTELFLRYRERVYGFFRRRMNDAAQAEELAQETFLAVLRAVQKQYVQQKWSAFGKMREIFDRGLKEFDDLALRKTGVQGPILPASSCPWLILPDFKVPQPRGITRH